ncbi:MAG: hypothetical protein V4517_02265 [Pseudomonadota bacterium]
MIDKKASQHLAPIFHRQGQGAIALQPVNLGGLGHGGEERELFIQNLVHDYPDVIPMAQIEPAFMPLVSICKELPTPAGYLDNLWITPEGAMVLGECKLVKNPQARREVVVQALDYARALSGWHFEQLEDAVQKALKKPGAKLWDFVAGESSLTENQFVDAIERRLQTGGFMILIIGDGIQEGVEALTRHLQLHAGMRVGLALLDLSIWQGVDGGLLIVPRVPMKTVLVERGVVRIDEAGRVRIEPVATVSSTASESRAQSQSEAEFYVQLDQKRSGLAAKFRAFVDEIAGLGVVPEPGGKSLFLRWKSPEGSTVTLACVETTGKVWSARALSDMKRAGMTDAAEQYLADVAATVGGFVKVYDNGSREVLSNDNKAVDLQPLLSSGGWRQAIISVIEKLAAAERQ